MTEESLFHEALARDPADRLAFLDAACAGRPELRTAVDALLAAHATATAPDAPTRTFDAAPLARDGQVIAGRYTLEHRLGEGGMGEVWVARQTEPVKRRVALKLIKPGMDSRAVLQRFEQERQALALMDHPNIARVLDGGLTDDARPYFVMELVNGLPLTRFCDELRMTPRERLELFVPICQAVQHAHQKGVVHRDLKPANILVTLIDGRPVPKVIDFGVAKATAGKLTDQSLSTQFGAVIGTLEYMSPEQAGFSGEDIDTRADIYSLGVILYELLTGLRPFDRNRLERAALTEMIRLIREEEPAKPSTRLSTEEALPSLAAMRRTEPRKLTNLLRELDWVVMKCLEKPRERRYETANALARDIQRFLADEPVEARPPTARYRLAKFVHRHRATAAAAALVLLTLLAGIAGTSWGLVRAEAARRAEAAQRRRAEDRERQAIAAVQRFGAAVAGNPELKNDPSLDNLRRTLLNEPIDFFRSLREQLLADADTRPESLHQLAQAASELASLTAEIGDSRDALQSYAQALQIRQRLARLQPGDPDAIRDLAATHNSLAALLITQGDTHAAHDALNAARALQEPLARDLPHNLDAARGLARTYNHLGVLLRQTGDTHDAHDAYQAALQIRRRLARIQPDDPEAARDLAATHNSLGNLLAHTGNADAARASYEAARDIRQRLARDHPNLTPYARDLAATHTNLATLLAQTGNLHDARASYEAARDLQLRLARDHPTVAAITQELARTHANLGNLLRDIGDPDAARASYEAARDLQQRLAREHPNLAAYTLDLAKTHNNLGILFTQTGNPRDARDAFEAARDLHQRLARDHPDIADFAHELAATHNNLGNLFRQYAQPDAARASYNTARELRERLARQHPDVTAYTQGLARTHVNLGNLLRDSGDPNAARASYEAARDLQLRLVRDQPTVTAHARDLAATHTNLGNLLRQTGDPNAARRELEAARDLRERLARDHPNVADYASQLAATLHNLANLELEAKRLPSARSLVERARQRQAAALAANPRNPTYRQNLKNHLTLLVQIHSALHDPDAAAEARRALAQLQAADPEFAATDARLAAVAAGAPAADSRERLALALRAYDTGRFALAARLWAEALDSNPDLAADRFVQHRYTAACAAALAATHADEPAAAATLRAQALAWLQQELDAWSQWLDATPADARSPLASTLEHWSANPDLASLRGAAIASLPESERPALVALWRDVARLRARADNPLTPNDPE